MEHLDGLKDVPLPLDQCVICEESDNWLYKIEKCIFVRVLGSQNCLPDEKMGLKKALLDGNFALKGITERELGSQNYLLPDGNSALKITYRTRIWP